MRKIPAILIGVALMAPSAARAQQPNIDNIVELEMLTHTELTQKQKQGFTSVLIITGGTEERGPHNILAGHTIMSRRHGIEMAKRLGKTLVAPVLPMAVQATGLREATDQPGGVQLPPDIFKAVVLAEIESQVLQRLQRHLRDGRPRRWPGRDESRGGRVG